jgi:hypothetical protein
MEQDKRNRWEKVEWLVDEMGLSKVKLLEELVSAMSEEEFGGCFKWICQCHDIPRNEEEESDLS